MSRILLIDDDPINNFLNKKIINEFVSSEIKVKDFLSPEDALKMLIHQSKNEKEELPEIIFLDINMPEMSGFEFLDLYIKNGLNLLPIVVYILSSSLDPYDIEISNSYAVIKEFISKPLEAETVKRILNIH